MWQKEPRWQWRSKLSPKLRPDLDPSASITICWTKSVSVETLKFWDWSCPLLVVVMWVSDHWQLSNWLISIRNFLFLEHVCGTNFVPQRSRTGVDLLEQAKSEWYRCCNTARPQNSTTREQTCYILFLENRTLWGKYELLMMSRAWWDHYNTGSKAWIDGKWNVNGEKHRTEWVTW